MKLPREPGIHLADSVKDTRPVPGKFGRKTKERLKDIAEENVLLFPWLTGCHGLPDLVALHCIEHGLPAKQRPSMLNVDLPLATGIPEPYSRMLLVCPKDDWLPLQADLAAGSALNREAGTYWQTILQVIPVLDQWAMEPGLMSRDSGLPYVDVMFMGLDGNQACYHFVPAAVLTKPVTLMKDTPFTQTVQKAKELLETSHN